MRHGHIGQLSAVGVLSPVSWYAPLGCPDWLQRLLWIYCPGHAGVSGNEQANRLASTADITSGLQLGGAEVLRGLRNFLNMDRPEHHSIDCLKERGVADVLPSEVENDLSSSRQILALFRGQRWRDCRETGRSGYGPFRALQCHLGLKLKLKRYADFGVSANHESIKYVTKPTRKLTLRSFRRDYKHGVLHSHYFLITQNKYVFYLMEKNDVGASLVFTK